MIVGRCVLCARDTLFDDSNAGADGSLRESLACAGCGCIARQRALAALLLQHVDAAGARVYLTEQLSPLYLALRRRLPRLQGSEWMPSVWRQLRLSSWLWRQGVPAWIRREDVTRLRFGDGSFDAAASLDVLEHVPDFRIALREFARVLRPGGHLLLTVPYDPALASIETLATRAADGTVTHLRPPEYHGDPLGGGVLCYHHFGPALLGEIRDAGFAEAEAIAVQDEEAGLPQPVWVLKATMPL